ncbi:hypothetical protein, unknown function [Leishmania infantum JPCM5]|uniref:Uncharacterized protein n=2 Tax=Leishmania infantum TaxID=5671 RepID=A4HTN8_LEIIN|nr:hypothetical protein, unknown function [Leishmania infantum JPCM5]CAC9451961.1 hypothetical_protein_-_conserved [Leishmania infantum]CAM65793.1 hypothetical protein, unknown function [Leishmania infantum JPCM5]SUZ39411.1 hypothetical_protein_-_conserved [Leishmania infantum]|eukprot:XP_001463429.1 hypothetical protein, unknown function [Leishmania infantum JPCM5]
MEPIRPAQRLERPPLPPLSPQRHDDIDDEDEEDESDVSTELESEMLSQHFKSLPWPFPAVNVPLGISPSASMRRGVSPLASDQQTCMSGSSLTAWSGAQVVCGGGAGTAWASGLGLNKFDKLRVSPRSGVSGASPRAGSGAASKGLATPTAVARPVTTTTAETTAPIATVTSSKCELTSENLDRLRETRAMSDALPVAHWKASTQTTRVSPPAVIAVSRARSDCAAGAGGTRMTRAAALLKQQPVLARQPRQRSANNSGARALADVPARASSTATAAKCDNGFNTSGDGPREGQGATVGATPTTSSTSPLAVAQGCEPSPLDEPTTLRAEEKDDSNGCRGTASGAGAAVTTAIQLPSAASPLARASSPRISHSRRKRDNVPSPLKRQRLASAKNRYQGQILLLEDCTETSGDATSPFSVRERAPRSATPAGAINAGLHTCATSSVVPATRATLSTPSDTKKSVPGAISPFMTSGRGVQASRRISVTAPAAHSGTLSPPSIPPFEKEAGQESSEAVRGTNQLPSFGLSKEENDQAAADIDDSRASCSTHTMPPENARQHIVHLPRSPQTRPAVPTPVSEKAGRDEHGADLRSVDQRDDEAEEPEERGEGALPTPVHTHQATSLLTSTSTTTFSRPPLLSLTAIGVTSITSGVLRSVTQTSPRLSAVLQRITLPHQPQQQVRPAVIISSAGMTELPPSRTPLTAVTTASPGNTGDSHISVSQASRLDSSRRSTVRTGTMRHSTSCDTRMPSSADCLPSVGSTQPPLSVRTPDGDGALRWRLTTSSRTSSAGASDQRARSGRAQSTDSISCGSTPSLLQEACTPAAALEHSSATVPSSHSGSKPPATFFSLDGQTGTSRLNGNHVSSSNTAATPTNPTTLVPAVPAPATASSVRARRSYNADKQQTEASDPAAVELATTSPATIAAGSDGSGRGSSVQAATRVRRTPAPGRQLSGGGRINLADLRASQPVHLGSAPSTSSAVSSTVARAPRDRPCTLTPLDGRVGHSPLEAAGGAGNGTAAAMPSMKADASGSPNTVVVAPGQ